VGHSIGATALSTFGYENGAEYGPADLAGSPISIPYQPGLTAGSRTLKGRDYTIYLTVWGTSRADYLSKMQSLTSLLLNPDVNGKPQAFTLTRTLELPSGTQICTIEAIYRDGLRFPANAVHWARVTPVLTLLDGWWLSGATKVYA